MVIHLKIPVDNGNYLVEIGVSNVLDAFVERHAPRTYKFYRISAIWKFKIAQILRLNNYS